MVENLLVSDQLTPEMIRFGEHLLGELGKSGLPVRGAFWNLLTEPKVWRLVIVSPEVRTAGPKSVYRKVQAAIKRMEPAGPLVDIGDISAIDDKAPLFLSIRKGISTGASTKGTRLSRSVIDGQSIEDAYVYHRT
jgi:hypothetical protein